MAILIKLTIGQHFDKSKNVEPSKAELMMNATSNLMNRVRNETAPMNPVT